MLPVGYVRDVGQHLELFGVFLSQFFKYWKSIDNNTFSSFNTIIEPTQNETALNKCRVCDKYTVTKLQTE